MRTRTRKPNGKQTLNGICLQSEAEGIKINIKFYVLMRQ